MIVRSINPIKKNSMKIVTIIAIGALSITTLACKKEKIKGCKVSYATNYKASAEEDDGSCEYESKIIFWQNQANANSWSLVGVTALKFYVDGQFIGSCAATEYNGSAPTCSGNGQASVTKKMGLSNSRTYSFSIKDQDGTEWYIGNITVDGNSCSTKQFN